MVERFKLKQSKHTGCIGWHAIQRKERVEMAKKSLNYIPK